MSRLFSASSYFSILCSLIFSFVLIDYCYSQNQERMMLQVLSALVLSYLIREALPVFPDEYTFEPGHHRDDLAAISKYTLTSVFSPLNTRNTPTILIVAQMTRKNMHFNSCTLSYCTLSHYLLK